MKLGLIGGSGLYDWDALEQVREQEVDTPFGRPSDMIVCGRLGGRDVCFLPRHGKGHRLMPSEINHRANIFALKLLGADAVISISAVGSLKEALRPRDIVLPDQYFDRTKTPASHTFFGNGIVAHIAFGEPACPVLRQVLAEAARETVAARQDCSVRVNEGGTYVNMEGPAFSTKAESLTYRKLGFDVIGMTSLAEAKLCREAELCYQALAMVTDYDCWHESEAAVTVEQVIAHLEANTALARDILLRAAVRIPEKRSCGCGAALRHAVLTAPDAIPGDRKRALAPLIGRYF
ncbi:MAG: S-methyl-5'-thioadenosine phosphorylase [Lentisphaerae bacterium]|nr:S-methyl-5'-thioadenosine phosphorylase [Lentisphaerota bacterium]